MAFIRTKRIKGLEYAYIVENNWKKYKVKQKSKLYLGRVYRFERIGSFKFSEYYNITDFNQYSEKRSKGQILADLVKIELLNHGFSENNEKLVNGEITVDGMKIMNSKGNNVAVAMNEGFLTGYALRKLLVFKGVCSEDGYILAKLFVEAGLNAPKELFITFFTKGI